MLSHILKIIWKVYNYNLLVTSGVNMTYTKTSWSEHLMSATTKATALTNLETIYDEACTYIDTITHAGRYYTKAECDSMFVTAANDGSGSNVICEKLDGYTAQQIIDSGISSGIICMWAKPEASIPSGWYLCNGSNSTPDLRNRFVICVGNDHAYGSTGGASHQTLSATSLTIGTHAITSAELPAHNHSYNDRSMSTIGGSGTEKTGYGTPEDHVSATSSASSTAHGHAGSYFTGGNTDCRPKFYALHFIMKG